MYNYCGVDYLNNAEQQVIPLIKFSFPNDRVIFQNVNAKTQIVEDCFTTRWWGTIIEHCMEINLKHCRSLSRHCHSQYVPQSKLKAVIQNISMPFFGSNIFFG